MFVSNIFDSLNSPLEGICKFPAEGLPDGLPHYATTILTKGCCLVKAWERKLFGLKWKAGHPNYGAIRAIHVGVEGCGLCISYHIKCLGPGVAQ